MADLYFNSTQSIVITIEETMPRLVSVYEGIGHVSLSDG